MPDDPLLSMRRAARLYEHLAAVEQKKKRPNLARMAEFMRDSAAITADLLQLERKLGFVTASELTGVTVEYVHTDAQYVALKAEAEALRLRVAELEAAQPAPALNVAPGVPQPPAPDSQPSATPAATNVVPISETREQKIARVRRENGDGPQSLRSGFSLDGNMLHEGRGRFDFPSRGW